MANLVVTRLGGALGARVDGVDASQVIGDNEIETLKSALYEHCVLVIPGQRRLTEQQHLAFASRWGELVTMKDDPLIEGSGSQLLAVHTDPGGEPIGNDWHSDLTFLERTPFVSILLARVLPTVGGDTMWASQYAAYEHLSPTLRAFLDTLSAFHIRKTNRLGSRAATTHLDGALHPVVRTIPETGKRALYLSHSRISHFEGMSAAESEGLLEFLAEHSTQPNFTFRHHWAVGDLVIWDNRCVLHYAIHDYNEERSMFRATVLGEVPAFV